MLSSSQVCIPFGVRKINSSGSKYDQSLNKHVKSILIKFQKQETKTNKFHVGNKQPNTHDKPSVECKGLIFPILHHRSFHWYPLETAPSASRAVISAAHPILGCRNVCLLRTAEGRKTSVILGSLPRSDLEDTSASGWDFFSELKGERKRRHNNIITHISKRQC